MKYSISVLALALVLTACGSTGPVKISNNTYMITNSSAAGAFTNMGKLKAETIGEANRFAEQKGKVAIAVSTNTVVPQTGFPSFEYQFMLVDKDDPRASDVKLSPRPDVVIENRNKLDAEIKTESIDKNAKSDMYTELMKLDDLKKKGILTEEEFNQQKQKLLQSR